VATKAYPRSIRLRARSEFQFLNRRGLRISLNDFIVRYLPNSLGFSRFGVTVSRRVGNAVVRNRVKRQLREAIRHERLDLSGVDVVVIAKPSARLLEHHNYRQQIREGCDLLRRSQA
jgi:ribonuclease P protein component